MSVCCYLVVFALFVCYTARMKPSSIKEATNDLSESQPTAGNIAGGLTTIEEKAFGNFQKNWKL